MSTYDDSSLFLYPSGYKASVLFAQKPMDANGQLAFTRSNDTATRVDENLLIEKVRTNQIRNSSMVGASAPSTLPTNWTLVLSGLTFSVIGTGTEDGLTYIEINATGTASASNARIGFDSATQILGATGQYWTNSFYFKKVSETAAPDSYAMAIFENTSAGSLVVANFGSFPATTSLARYSYTVLTAGGATVARVQPFVRFGLTSGNSYNFTFRIAAPQMEQGDIATQFIPTSTAAVSVGPLANIPRIDYLGGGCGKLLLEPQATALNQFSESFDNAYWIKNDVTISANTTETLDPAGYYGADKVVETATPARHRVAAGSTTISAANHTASVFMKKGTARYGFVTFSGAAVSTIVVDLENGTITSTSTSGTIVAQKVEDYGSGWYRISVTALGTATTTTYTLQFGSAGSATPSYTSNIPSFTGSTSNYLYAWGANLTATSYLQSYIPTLAASVTRGADACSKTGISSLIGQTQGTLFVEINANATGLDQNFELGDGSSANRINLRLIGGANLFQLVIVQVASVVFNQTSVATFAQGQNLKIAVVYKSGAVTQMFVNGVSVITGTAGSITGNLSGIFTGLSGGSTALVNSPVKQILVFKTALTNTQAIELTA